MATGYDHTNRLECTSLTVEVPLQPTLSTSHEALGLQHVSLPRLARMSHWVCGSMKAGCSQGESDLYSGFRTAGMSNKRGDSWRREAGKPQGEHSNARGRPKRGRKQPRERLPSLSLT